MQQQGDLRIASTRRQMEQNIGSVLPLVTKPNQYLGNELNVCSKDHSKVDLRIVLAYPDTYFIGMSHQGLKILYHILNRRDDVWAERVYAPWVDMESQMRKRGIPLFSLESQTPVSEYDVLGFTLQHELNFTNLLNMLDLAQIPLRARDRHGGFPLVLAGGSCASNPEPLAEFVDAFVIGDGEVVVEEIADLLIRGKKEKQSRHETLVQLAGLQGVYVPCLYRAEYDRMGRFRELIPLDRAAPSEIRARVVERLDLSNYPLRPIVPLTEIAHDRLSIEIMRGCTQGCRYCHAGMVYRPVREKLPQHVLQEAVAGIVNSGWDEISLVSLSSSDYSCLLPLVSEVNRLLVEKKVALSLPSMRPDTFSERLAQSMKNVRRTGLTFAPESGTARLRKVINKNFQEEDLLESLRIAFENGWESVKLYFMIGLPTETWDDLDGIVELGRKVHRLTRRKGKRELHVSISPFTPKPHTPFQWERQDPIDLLAEKSRYLKSRLPHRGMRVTWRDPHVSFLEAVFSRGDRRLGGVLEMAWRDGCIFDSWTEQFDYSRWASAFSRAAADPRCYTEQWPLEGPLPWGHINYGVREQFLQQERERAMQGLLTKDCRSAGCHGCGAHRGGFKRATDTPEAMNLRMDSPLIFGRGKKHRRSRHPQVTRTRIRIQYAKGHLLQYLSHLDMVRLFERAIRRADLPIAYSEGFHPHPKMAFGPPLPLGLTSRAEYLDLQFTKPLVGDLAYRLGSALPMGMEILATKALFRKTESLQSAICVAEYRVDIGKIPRAKRLQEAVADLLSTEHLPVQRVTPRETKTVDIRDHLLDLRLKRSGKETFLTMQLGMGKGGYARPQEILDVVLDLSHEELFQVPIERTGQFIEINGKLLSPLKAI